MSDIELTFVQRCALVVLMAEAREVPNAHLTNVRRLRLEKPGRDGLVKAGLLNVRQERRGGPAFLELSDKGWRRAIEEFGEIVPDRAGAGGAALYVVLEKIGQFLDRSNTAAADLFATPDEVEEAPPPDVEALIRKAYGELAQRAGDYVHLARLRTALPQLASADMDAALVGLNGRFDVRLVPESDQKTLTDDQRAAAVSIGNQDRHLIAIDS